MTSTENLQRITDEVPPTVRAALERVLTGLHEQAERRAYDGATEALRHARRAGQSLASDHPLNATCDKLHRLLEAELTAQYFSQLVAKLTAPAT